MPRMSLYGLVFAVLGLLPAAVRAARNLRADCLVDRRVAGLVARIAIRVVGCWVAASGLLRLGWALRS